MANNYNDKDPNYIQNDFDDRFNHKNLEDAEKKSATGNESTNNSNANQTKEAEENPDSKWQNNVLGNNKSSKVKGKFSFLKKKGPVAFIVSSLIVGSLGIATFFSPGILIVHLKEVMAHKFNAQLASMDVRTGKMLTTKTTKGACSSGIKILCKFSSMSDRQIANFEKAGIIVNSDETNIIGQKKPTSFEYEGKKITAENFYKEVSTNPNFSSAVSKGYNPMFAGFADKIWTKVSLKLNISKKAKTFRGDTFDEKLSNLSEDIKNTTGVKKMSHVSADDPDPDNPGNTYGEEGAKKANANIDKFNELLELSGGDGSTASKIINGANTVANVVSVTGAVDDVCTVYRIYKAVGFAAKTVRTMQLASYAFLFMNVADQIKAGNANEADVSFLGTILTNESLDDEENPKSATDSYGYKYTAYGDIGNSQTGSMAFMAAGGLTGSMAGLLEHLAKNQTVMTTCKVVGNPLVMFGSILAGAGIAIASGGTSLTANLSKEAIKASLKATVKAAVKSPDFWKDVGIVFAGIYLPNLLKDIVAGNLVDETTVGANAGDAITSGASGVMATTAKYGGNAPLLPDQAVDYAKLTEKIASRYDQEEKIALSPFDVYSTNTFFGKIVGTLLPYTSKMSSLTGFFSSISSITSNSLAYAMYPNANAYSEPTEEEFMLCQDEEYRDLNLATDPFCNVRYGITTDVLEGSDPVEVAEYMLGVKIPTGKSSEKIEKFITDEGEPTEIYKGFIDNCIDRETPLIKSKYTKEDPNGREDDGASECIFNESYETEDFDEKWCDADEEKPDPSPSLGYLYLYDWDEGTGEDCGTIENPGKYMITHYIYMGNAYLYLYYIDKRIEDGMEETDAISSSSKSISGKLSSPVSGFDWSKTGLSEGESSDHGGQDHGTWLGGDAYDIPCSTGETAYASHSGKVTVDNSYDGTDNWWKVNIRIENDDYMTLYAHINPSVSTGDNIEVGQPIGTCIDLTNVGDRGYISKPHVHFEMKFDNKSIVAGDMPPYFM